MSYFAFVISEIEAKNKQAERLLDEFMNIYNEPNPLMSRTLVVDVECLYSHVYNYIPKLNENEQMIVAERFEVRDNIINLIHDLF